MSEVSPNQLDSPTDDNNGERSAKRVKRNYVACRRCHLHKVKCTGGNPCQSCQNNKINECVYPPRDRKITVSEAYLKKLEAEIASLKAKDNVININEGSEQASARASEEAVQVDRDIQNPLFEGSSRRPRAESFVQQQATFVGESACTAFGDHLLLSLGGNDDAWITSPIERDFVKHSSFSRTSNPQYQLPDRIQANLLVRVAVRFIGSDYHQFQTKDFMEKLDQLYKSKQPCEDTVWLCKLFVVLALGELYANRHNDMFSEGSSVPGTGYFVQAVTLLQDLHEEATISQIETLLLLSFYSNALGRTNSAYVYSGLALRLGLILGLNRAIATDQIKDPVAYENGTRVWWTVYVFDRLLSSRLGHPLTIHDDDIDVALPSTMHLSPIDRERFTPPDHLCANIRLARITGEILQQIYGLPRPSRRSFVHNVRKILTSLRAWDKDLPESLRLKANGNLRPISSLHLHFNLCIIQTTRPILLHVFKIKNPFTSTSASPSVHETQTSTPRPSAPPPPAPALSQTTLALSDACIQAARVSNGIITQCFIENSLAIFGYFDAHYLYSSTLILIMSAVMEPNALDSDAVQTALSLLQSMRKHGNVSAKGYHERLNRIKMRISQLRTAMTGRQNMAHEAMVSPGSHRVAVDSHAVPSSSGHHTATPAPLPDDHTAWSLFPFAGDLFPTDWNMEHTQFDGPPVAGDGLNNPFIVDFLSQARGGPPSWGDGDEAFRNMRSGKQDASGARGFSMDFDDGFRGFA